MAEPRQQARPVNRVSVLHSTTVRCDAAATRGEEGSSRESDTATLLLVDPFAGFLAGLPSDSTVLLFQSPPTVPYGHSTLDGDLSRPRKKQRRAKDGRLVAEAKEVHEGVYDAFVEPVTLLLNSEFIRNRTEPWWLRDPSRVHQHAHSVHSFARPESFVNGTFGEAGTLDDGIGEDRSQGLHVDALHGRFIQNDAPIPMVFSMGNAEESTCAAFFMPSQSAILTTDLLQADQRRFPPGWQALLSQVREHGGVDLLYVDPPYPNMSAERLARSSMSANEDGNAASMHRHSSYATAADLYDLWRLRAPLTSLLAASRGQAPARRTRTLVAFWITNAPKVRRFILNKFWPQLGVRYEGEWCWLKMTAGASSGARGFPPQPVVSMAQPERKKPYEILLLGWAGGDAGAAGQRGEQQAFRKQIFASVPIGHSRKPAIVDLLAEYVHQQRALEPAAEAPRRGCIRKRRVPQTGTRGDGCLLAVELFGRTALSGSLLHAPLTAGAACAAALPVASSSSAATPECGGDGDSDVDADERNACRCVYVSVGNEASKFNQHGVGLLVAGAKSPAAATKAVRLAGVSRHADSVAQD
ncbi:hypothetical protein K437DRAFT_258918 [Tilletiaria anomala UBC 951]|uniref:MT-A70-domain-containing protein n=1 Tax=Tilletiaria anomala (strain ATCC 24038 / CBS 436.72 / UBC 951) TaxID=1037660 RepID=A0A066VLW9_TILAU|nr:uncharacterized protein K437DRAFT_258918 [Tilletiaria anomala UBC 951]KDN39749.1 hypothetical protein K437DRAFT_258918 [Tilletiaria anomala UBC 951]